MTARLAGGEDRAIASQPTPPGRRAGAIQPHRSFDPRRVGRLECDAWVSYYRRQWPAFLRSAVRLTRHTFGLPWPQTLYGAWLVLRANQLWAPFPDNHPEQARRVMERFYRLLASRYGEPTDAARASQLEVEWWRVHREHQHAAGGPAADDGLDHRGGGPGADDPPDHRDGALVDALAALYAYVYGVAPGAVRPAARERALAMDYSDRWVRDGRIPDSPLIAQVRAALVRSYAALLSAVHTVPRRAG